jgi:hypothetical protein
VPAVVELDPHGIWTYTGVGVLRSRDKCALAIPALDVVTVVEVENEGGVGG